MPDNWSYVTAAYLLAAIVFGAYWRWLTRKDHELKTLAAARAPRAEPAARVDPTSRSHHPSRPAHPRTEPDSRPPLP
jgi:hypothetical protein